MDIVIIADPEQLRRVINNIIGNSEKYIDLDTGDKIQITAILFSTALNDPWLDVQNITVIKKAAPKTTNK